MACCDLTGEVSLSVSVWVCVCVRDGKTWSSLYWYGVMCGGGGWFREMSAGIQSWILIMLHVVPRGEKRWKKTKAQVFLSTNTIQKSAEKRHYNILCCRSTTHVFVVAVAVGGCSVWRWNGGWVSVRPIVSSCIWKRRTCSVEHLPQDMSVKAAPSVSAAVLSGGCGGSLTAGSDLIHERSIRFSLNGRVIVVCWRLGWQLPHISLETTAQWSCRGGGVLLELLLWYRIRMASKKCCITYAPIGYHVNY